MTELIDLATALGWAEYALTVCGIAAVVAMLAPPATETSPAWWKHSRRVLDILAANFGNARNRMP